MCVFSNRWGRWWGTACPRAERSCSCGASACDTVVSSPKIWFIEMWECRNEYNVNQCDYMWFMKMITKSTLIIFNQRYANHQPWTSALHWKSNLWFVSLTWNWMCQKSKQDPSWAQTAAEEAEKALLFELFFCFDWTSDSFSLWLEEFAFCILQSLTDFHWSRWWLQACAKFISSWKNMKKTTSSSILHSVRTVQEDTWSMFLVSPVTWRQTYHGCNSKCPTYGVERNPVCSHQSAMVWSSILKRFWHPD